MGSAENRVSRSSSSGKLGRRLVTFLARHGTPLVFTGALVWVLW